jgi:hypothetical protein
MQIEVKGKSFRLSEVFENDLNFLSRPQSSLHNLLHNKELTVSFKGGKKLFVLYLLRAEIVSK